MKNVSLPLLIWNILFIALHTSGQETGSEKKNKADLTGSLTFFNQAYYVSGIEPRRDDFTWRLTGNPTLVAGRFQLPLHVQFGSFQDNTKQSFNKIGISPAYDNWLKAHLGFFNIDFSRLIVSGKPFLGAGIELTPSVVRLGFVYGRLQRAIHSDSTVTPPPIPAFKRTGYAVKVGFGKKDRFVDLIWFKAKDDTASIDYTPYETPVKPQENAAFGIVARGDFLHKVFLEIDGALSLYTRDLLARRYAESEFSFADEMEPLLPYRTSTQITGALQTKIEYRGKGYKIGFSYHRITPDYETMGIYYLLNDVQRFLLTSEWKMLKRKMAVSARVGVENNNLLKTMTATSLRTLGMLNVFWMMNQKTSMSLYYSNHQLNVTDERGSPLDSLQPGQTMNVMNASVQHHWNRETQSHLCSLSGNYQASRHFNRMESLNNTHTFNFISDYSVTFEAIRFTLLGGFEYNQTLSSVNTAFYGPVIGATQLLAEKKLTLTLRTNVSAASTGGAASAITTRMFFNLSYRVIGKHLIRLRIVFLNNSARDFSSTTFSELQGDVSYTVQF